MKFGYFDDAAQEYVITTPKTPLPWINYLGTNEFFTLISNTCGGYTFYKDAKLLRLTRYRYNNVPADINGKYIYIKDGECVWNPGWQPTKTELDSYECHHGIGYSKFVASKNELEASVLTFIPVADNCEISQLTLTNHSKEEKEFSVFSYVEWCLWNIHQDTKRMQEFSVITIRGFLSLKLLSEEETERSRFTRRLVLPISRRSAKSIVQSHMYTLR